MKLLEGFYANYLGTFLGGTSETHSGENPVKISGTTQRSEELLEELSEPFLSEELLEKLLKEHLEELLKKRFEVCSKEFLDEIPELL